MAILNFDSNFVYELDNPIMDSNFQQLDLNDLSSIISNANISTANDDYIDLGHILGE